VAFACAAAKAVERAARHARHSRERFIRLRYRIT
jgi:hypothetical protein